MMNINYDPLLDVRIDRVAPQSVGESITISNRTAADNTQWVVFKSLQKYSGEWYACRVDPNGNIPVDLVHSFIVGWNRPDSASLLTLLDSIDASFIGERKGKRKLPRLSRYVDSESGIKLDPRLRWQERMRGVVFANVKTKKEFPFPGTMAVARKKLGMSGYQLNNMLFEGKVINGWYIDRIDPDAPPIVNRTYGDGKYRFLKCGGLTVPIELAIQTIENITMLTTTEVKGLLSGKLEEVNGWRAV